MEKNIPSIPFLCRIWLADVWHTGMSRKGTCILSYPLPFISGRIGQALRRGKLKSAGLSRLGKPPHRSGKTIEFSAELPTKACWIHGKSPLGLYISGFCVTPTPSVSAKPGQARWTRKPQECQAGYWTIPSKFTTLTRPYFLVHPENTSRLKR